MMRVKLVVITRIEGARERTVSSITIESVVLKGRVIEGVALSRTEEAATEKDGRRL